MNGIGIGREAHSNHKGISHYGLAVLLGKDLPEWRHIYWDRLGYAIQERI
jgi:hypothetical protein